MIKEFDAPSKMNLLKAAHRAAEQSTCVSRKVGAILSFAGSPILLDGYNDMNGTTCSEQQACRCFNPNRVPGKDLDKCFASHAETKAIGNAARRGYKTENAIMFVTDLPCTECAKQIIEAGISHVVYDRDYPDSKAQWLFHLAGVTYEQMEATHDVINTSQPQEEAVVK